jgi:hypothetical protein
MAVASDPTSHVTVKTETDSETMCSFRNNKSIDKVQKEILSEMYLRENALLLSTTNGSLRFIMLSTNVLNRSVFVD